jgi:hypothetical protein
MPTSDHPEGINLIYELFNRRHDAVPELPTGMPQLFVPAHSLTHPTGTKFG